MTTGRRMARLSTSNTVTTSSAARPPCRGRTSPASRRQRRRRRTTSWAASPRSRAPTARCRRPHISASPSRRRTPTATSPTVTDDSRGRPVTSVQATTMVPLATGHTTTTTLAYGPFDTLVTSTDTPATCHDQLRPHGRACAGKRSDSGVTAHAYDVFGEISRRDSRRAPACRSCSAATSTGSSWAAPTRRLRVRRRWPHHDQDHARHDAGVHLRHRDAG